MEGRTVISSRELATDVGEVYQVFAEAALLKEWWGPEGFTNTIHLFDLRPGGRWVLTMHGPEKGNYENESIFEAVEPDKRVAWRRISQPIFDMEIGFENIGAGRSKITFRMVFASAEECEKMRKFVEPKNEENFDRLERVLAKMKGQG